MVKMLKSKLLGAPQRVKPAAVNASDTRLRGRPWMRIRDRVMRRDCGLCQQCKREGRLQMAEQVDHKGEHADGGSDDDSNLEALCGDCHKVKTTRSQAMRRGREGG